MVGVPRQTQYQMVHYLRKGWTFADNGKVLTVGTLPAGALVLKPLSGIHVDIVANAGTNNFADLGVTGDADLFGTDLSLLAVGFIPIDEAVAGYILAADIDVIFTPQLSGTAATTGSGEVVICYIPDNDG